MPALQVLAVHTLGANAERARPRLTLAPLLPHNPSADDRDRHRVYVLGAPLTRALETTVHTLDSGEAVCGQDEPGVPRCSLTLCNAIHALTGKRIRKCPPDMVRA